MPKQAGKTPHTPIKPSPLSQPPLRPESPDFEAAPSPRDPPRTGWDRFFSMENPVWTMFPIFLSVAALWFAYKSNVINREWADVHLRITTQAFMGYYLGEDYFIEDDIWYFPSVMGDLQSMEGQMRELVFATNDLGLRWLAESVGWDLENVTSEDLPYNQFYIFLAIGNDGDQIANDLYIKFDYYKVDDQEELRTEGARPENVEPEEWLYGPGIIPPDQWVVIPLGSCYIRIDPTSDEPDIKYIGDFYDPIELTYYSAVSGTHSEPMNIDEIPQTMNSFTDPPAVAQEDDGAENSGGSTKGGATR